MQIVERKIEELKPAEYNPRQMTEEQNKNLKESIERFGLVDPIIVNQHPDRVDIVVGGHQRLRIAKDLGFETVPCVYVNLEETKERELNLRLNKNTGEWNWDALSNEFDTELLFDVGFDGKDFQVDLKQDEEEEQPKESNERFCCNECGFQITKIICPNCQNDSNLKQIK